MSRNHDFNSQKVCLVGRSGRGKSTFQRQLLKAWGADYVFIFDHKDEFKNKMGAYQCRTPAQAHAALTQTKSVCWKPAGGLKAAFSRWCEGTFEACMVLPGRKLMVFDEFGLLVPRHPTKPLEVGGVELDFWHPLQAVMETGREYGIDVLCASQRPAHLALDFRGQITQWICFQCPGGWVKPLEKDYEEDFSAVTTLDRGRFVGYDADTSEFFKGQSKP